MKVYFSAALAQQRQYGDVYKRIVARLKKLGHLVYEDTTTTPLARAMATTDRERFEYYQQVLRWIHQADLVVVEVSFPSTLHIGHEISLALDKIKPIVALYEQNKEPSFFLGLEHSQVVWQSYSRQNLEKMLEMAVLQAEEKTDIRYNLKLSHRHYRHLEQQAKKLRIPKAAVVRKLIEEDITPEQGS